MFKRKKRSLRSSISTLTTSTPNQGRRRGEKDFPEGGRFISRSVKEKKGRPIIILSFHSFSSAQEGRVGKKGEGKGGRTPRNVKSRKRKKRGQIVPLPSLLHAAPEGGEKKRG